jgi:hypothetical protein
MTHSLLFILKRRNSVIPSGVREARNPSSHSDKGTPAWALDVPRDRRSPDQHLGLCGTHIPAYPKPRPACTPGFFRSLVVAGLQTGLLQSNATNSPLFTLAFRTNVHASGGGAPGPTLPTATGPALAAEAMVFSSSPLVPGAPYAGVACGSWVTPRRGPTLLDPISAKSSGLEDGSFVQSFTFARFYSFTSCSSPKQKTYTLTLVTPYEAHP